MQHRLVQFVCFFGAWLALPNSSVPAQVQATIRGIVLDADTRQPLPGATVVAVRDSARLAGTYTDSLGRFQLVGLPVGRLTVAVSYIGYEPAVFSNQLVTVGRELELEAQLREDIITTEEVQVLGRGNPNEALNDMATVSSRSFSVEETWRYAATFLDPGRMAQTFAGVAMGGDDLRNEIVVRGNSPRGLLWRLEGIEIPNPNHFANLGTPGGAISMLSANSLATSDFLTGAFPAEYGNALSGVMDLNFRNGNPAKHQHAIQFGVLGTELASEGPISRRAGSSYIATYRYSTLAILSQMGINLAGDIVPAFQDFTFKLNLPTRRAGTFSVSGIAGYSTYRIDPEPDSTRWETLDDTRRIHEQAFTGMVVLGHTVTLGRNTFLGTRLLGAFNYYRYDRWQLDTLTTGLPELPDFFEDYRRPTYRLSSFVQHKFSARSKVRVGAIVSSLGYDMEMSTRFPDDTLRPWLGVSGTWLHVQGYVQWHYRLGSQFTLNTGLHAMWLGFNQTGSVEPRAGLRWHLAQRHSLNLGAGIHSRLEDPTVLLAQRRAPDGTTSTPNQGLDIPKAAHAVLGWEYRPARAWRLRLEGYYQYLWHLPVNRNPARPDLIWNFNYVYDFIARPDTFVSSGLGRNYGVELTAERSLQNGWYGFLTTSLFRSEYQATDNRWYSTRFDLGYIVNLVGGKEFPLGTTGKTLLGVNARAVLMGGQHYNTVDRAASVTAQEEIWAPGRMAEQLPAYWRVDGGLTLTLNGLRATHLITANVQNATNRLNVFTRSYDPETDRFSDIYQVGLTPILNYRVTF